jgi:hypothetical protein
MFEIRWSNGRIEQHETYEAAKDAVWAECPEAEIGHDGDLDSGGDRTLCWADEGSSVDDDGAFACCSIREIKDGI